MIFFFQKYNFSLVNCILNVKFLIESEKKKSELNKFETWMTQLKVKLKKLNEI